MSITYGFYDAVYTSGGYDREYTAEQFSAIFDGLITDGVYSSYGGHFAVTPSSGMTVVVASGRAWFNHTWTLNDAPINVTIAVAAASLDRIDAIVIQINHSDRVNSVTVVQGALSSSPVKPTLTADQHPLAYITVTHQMSEITSEKITNAIGTSECPFITGVVQQVTTDQLLTQWREQFDELLNYLSTEIYQVEQEVGADLKPIVGYNISIGSSAWSTFSADSGSEEAAIISMGYTYRALVPLDNVLANMRPYITWSLPDIDACGANILNQCQCTIGGVYVYADARPVSDITVLTLECRKAVI